MLAVSVVDYRLRATVAKAISVQVGSRPATDEYVPVTVQPGEVIRFDASPKNARDTSGGDPSTKCRAHFQKLSSTGRMDEREGIEKLVRRVVLPPFEPTA